MLLNVEESVVLVVDMQPTFLSPIHCGPEVLSRCLFLVHAANLLKVPVIHTEQYPERMGATEDSLQTAIGTKAFPKMAFSCMGSDEVVNGLEKLGRTQVILCGIESHICVNQTAHDLLEEDYSVVLAHDAISARTLAMHEGAMARMKELGALSAHTESILYEWMETAEHPQFKAALSLVKSYPAP